MTVPPRSSPKPWVRFFRGCWRLQAGLGPLIGEVAGVQPAAITFKKADGSC